MIGLPFLRTGPPIQCRPSARDLGGFRESNLLEQITALRPAARTQSLGFSEIVKIRNRVLELRQQGTPVLQLE
ncbi:MAG TPA: hypothetical protein VM534_04350, partial [Thermoanaerobaculia bacterium]|nr:hypothetical protein [Thermoanaerobaculia bacterium]